MHVHRQVLAAAERAADPGECQPDPVGPSPSAEQIWRWSTCSHCVATNRSTPPVPSGTASPDSGPRNAWSCIPTS